MATRPRQRDIAAHAQVSQTTVSLVLNGKSQQYGITADTERKIMNAITELGYVPSVTAQALRGGRNGLIGVHTFERLFPTGPEHYYYEFMVGIEQAATAAGQDLVMITSVHQQGADPSIYHDGMNRLQIADGAVILGFHEHDQELEALARQQFPFVFIGRRRRAAELMPYVVPDYAEGVTRVVGLLADKGHKRVAYLTGQHQMLPREERYAGFRAARAGAGLKLIERRAIDVNELTRSMITSLIERSVSAVVIDSYPLTERFGELCDQLDIAIPRQLGVVCLDSLGYGASRSWTHMQTPRRELGARSVDILLGLLNGDHPRTHHETLRCPIDTGSTLLPLTDMTTS